MNTGSKTNGKKWRQPQRRKYISEEAIAAGARGIYRKRAESRWTYPQGQCPHEFYAVSEARCRETVSERRRMSMQFKAYQNAQETFRNELGISYNISITLFLESLSCMYTFTSLHSRLHSYFKTHINEFIVDANTSLSN